MKKRSIKKVPNTKEENLVELIKRIPKKPIASYAAFTYLFGNRVSEGIGMPKVEILGQYTYHRTTKKGTKTVQIPKTKPIKDAKGNTVYELEPLRVWQIEYEKEKNLLWVRSIPTLKRPGRPDRDVWVLANGPNEKPLAELLLSYVEAVKKEEGEQAYLWTFSRNTAFKMFRKYLGINNFPHKIRDLRATKDSTVYGLDAKDLLEKYNWSTPEMPMYYARKNKTEIIDKMIRNQKNALSATDSYQEQ